MTDIGGPDPVGTNLDWFCIEQEQEKRLMVGGVAQAHNQNKKVAREASRKAVFLQVLS